MKRIIIAAVMLFVSTIVCAQTFDEWFRQKRTQRKYLLQQIAALRIYGSSLSKGYQLVKSGLDIISNIKQGDFGLHDQYFTSLSLSSAVVRNSSWSTEIVLLQKNIQQDAISTMRYCLQSATFKPEELSWLQATFIALLDDCDSNIDALNTILTNGTLSMKDDERIKLIKSIHDNLQANKLFSGRFSASCKTLCLQRMSEQFQIQQSQKLNGLK